MSPMSSPVARERLPRGFAPLIGAQFASALADNALLIVAIARLHERGDPAWWAPLLKIGFTLSYVLLAPFVGALADAVAKARLMSWMNGVKVLGVLGLMAGVHPLLAFAVVGFGAAAYAPAKYGLVTELVPPARLVAANGWIEVSVVFAALFGAMLGGALVAPALLQAAPWPALQALLPTPGRLGPSMLALVLLYALAAWLNLRIPDSGARYPRSARHPARLLREFVGATRLLASDRDGGLSLAVTTLFWGVGATLQFAVLRWAEERLALPLSQAAALEAVVALGVVAGAAAAGRFVALGQARRVLGLGVVLGGLMAVIAWSPSLTVALPLLVAVGAVGGLLVVPLNALLQHRGATLLSAGRSIAVQGFAENSSVLAMLAAYAALTALGLPAVWWMTGFGLAIALAMRALRRSARRGALRPSGAAPRPAASCAPDREP